MYFQIFAVFVGLFILADPFKAVTVDEEIASGAWQVVPCLSAESVNVPEVSSTRKEKYSSHKSHS